MKIGFTGCSTHIIIPSRLSEIDQSLDQFRSYQTPVALNFVIIAAQYVENMQGQADDPSRLIGSFMVEDDLTEKCNPEDHSTVIILQELHPIRTLLLYILNEHDRLESDRLLFLQYKENKSTTYHRGFLWALYALNSCRLARLYRHDTTKTHWNRHAKKKAAETTARKYYKQLGFYLKEGQVSPDVSILADLVQAELWTLLDYKGEGRKKASIMEWYMSALEGFTRHQLWVFRAITYERAAEYLFSIRQRKQALEFVLHAWNAYGDYGATVKMEALMEQYQGVVAFPESVEQHVCSSVVQANKLEPMLINGGTGTAA